MPDLIPEDSKSPVQSFYGTHVDVQWSRFEGMARIEEYVLRKSLNEHLPPAPAIVGDIGGGNGRHAFHLAQLGYQVRVCDITAELVADASRRNDTAGSPLASVELADARDLGWADECLDGALMLGPMYCLQAQADRAGALIEAVRVLKPGAPLLVQFFSRIAALRTLLEAVPAAAGIFAWRDFLQSGVFIDEHIPDFLRVHYFSLPSEAINEVLDVGLELDIVRGMDGPAPSFGQRNLAGAPEHILRQWGEIAYELGVVPDYQCTSMHLLIIARKPSVRVLFS